MMGPRPSCSGPRRRRPLQRRPGLLQEQPAQGGHGQLPLAQEQVVELAQREAVAALGAGVGDSTLAGGSVGTGTSGPGGTSGGAASMVGRGPLSGSTLLNTGRPGWR